MSLSKSKDQLDPKSPVYGEMNEESADIDDDPQLKLNSNRHKKKKVSFEHLKCICRFFMRKKTNLSPQEEKKLLFICLGILLLLAIILVIISLPGAKTLSKLLERTSPRNYTEAGSRFFTLPVLNEANATLPHDKNIPILMLCKLNISNYCFSHKIVDSLDLVYAIEPIYAEIQNRHQQLYDYHKYFISYLLSIGINTIELEALYPNQTVQIIPNFTTFNQTEGVVWMIDDSKKPVRIYMQTNLDEYFYIRENYLNVAAKKFLDLWEYIIWIDAHQIFMNPYWWEETIYKMEHYNIVQMFQNLSYIHPDNHTVLLYGNAAVSNMRHTVHEWDNSMVWFRGNAWGVRKEIYLKLGYILDTCIGGGCDVILQWGCLGLFGRDLPWFAYSPYYMNYMDWVRNALEVIDKKAADVRGTIAHFDHFHYFNYMKVQEDLYYTFNVTRDLYRDKDEVLHLRNEAIKNVFSRMP